VNQLICAWAAKVRLEILLDSTMIADGEHVWDEAAYFLKLREALGAVNDTLRKNRHGTAGHAGS